jgi:hypothetical protein
MIPNKTADFIAWAAQRAPVWAASAGELGISPQLAAAVQQASLAAAASMRARDAAMAGARSATAVLKEDIRDLRRVVVEAVQLIRISAQNAQSPALVYQLAQVPAPAQPAPLPPPGVCAGFKVGLDAEGNVVLAWKCRNPPSAQGTVYMIWRRVNDAGDFEFIGASGVKKFADLAIPRGAWQIEYRVQTRRASALGPVSIWTVRFGGAGGGAEIAEQFGGADDRPVAPPEAPSKAPRDSTRLAA